MTKIIKEVNNKAFFKADIENGIPYPGIWTGKTIELDDGTLKHKYVLEKALNATTIESMLNASSTETGVKDETQETRVNKAPAPKKRATRRKKPTATTKNEQAQSDTE